MMIFIMEAVKLVSSYIYIYIYIFELDDNDDAEDLFVPLYFYCNDYMYI